MPDGGRSLFGRHAQGGMSKAERNAKIVEMYDDGWTYQAMATALHISTVTIVRAMRDMGIKPRPPGGDR